MKKAMTRKMSGAMATGVTLLVLAVPGWAMGHGEGGHDPQRMLERMTQKLSLDDAQRQQVQTLLEESQQTSSVSREQIRDLKDQLQVMRVNLDTDKARAIADELGDLTAQRALEKTQLQAGVYQILTPQQRTELESLMAERQEKRERRFGSERHSRK